MAGELLVIDSNHPKVSRRLQGIFRNQRDFVESRAINDTAKDAQKAQRKHQDEIFNIRSKRFIQQAVKIDPFAKKGRPTAVVRHDPPGGQRRSDIAGKFESQRQKVAKDGGRIAVPTDAVRTKSGRVRKGKRPGDFNFRRVGSGALAEVYEGDGGTFMIRRPDGSGGIYRRSRRSRASRRRRPISDVATRRVRDANITTLYRFRKSVAIEPELRFVETVLNTAERRAPRHFQRWWLRAIKTAK